MTIEALNTLLKKQKGEKIEIFVEILIIAPTHFGKIPVREWFKIYLHSKYLDIQVIQAVDKVISREQMNKYTTKGLIEFLR